LSVVVVSKTVIGTVSITCEIGHEIGQQFEVFVNGVFVEKSQIM
jgi:hypothetical protein